MLQLIYVSSASPGTPADPANILTVSDTNNRRDGLTGLLYADGRRFLQVLEGEPDRVARTFDRIQADPRHRAIVVLSRREIDEREFGNWSMARIAPGEAAEAFIARVSTLVAEASPDVRATFEGFAEVRHAA